ALLTISRIVCVWRQLLSLPTRRSSDLGWLNTANALGYLLGSLMTVATVQRFGNHRLFTLGAALTALALLLTGLTRDFTLLTLYRSEEHTSELQSRENLVCRLLLEKKNT